MKAGIYAKLKWLRKPETPPRHDSPMPDVETRPGWFTPQSAAQLLATPLRQQLMKIIWQRTSVSSALFNELYRTPIVRFAELAQQLPASEYHHHAYPGGLLDHSLEVMAFAAKLRQQYLLPVGAAPEDQAREAEAWTAGILYAALLHDAGKMVADMNIITEAGSAWHPWQGPPGEPCKLKYRKPRDYRLHPVAGSLLVSRILPATSLNWLAQFPELYAYFLYCISGHYDQAGVLGEVVQDADRASVAQFMGARADSVLDNPQPSLAKQLLTALRELVLTRYKLNNPDSGSDGWLTEDALWLVSKSTADNIRGWLLQQGVTSVPENNIRLFDEMQAQGLIVPSPEGKAIWHCAIHSDSGWTPGRALTLLRLSPQRFWPQRSEQPAVFRGRVTAVQATAAGEGANGASPSSVGVADAAVPSESASLLFSLFDGNESPDTTMRDAMKEGGLWQDEGSETGLSDAAVTGSMLVEQAEPVDDVAGEHFLAWLREGVRSRAIAVNHPQAPLHLVNGKVLLVSPAIFKLHTPPGGGQGEDAWRQVQRRFEKLKRHEKAEGGRNIFTCQVKGARRTRLLNGYLLKTASDIFGDTVPEDNPHLSVVNEGRISGNLADSTGPGIPPQLFSRMTADKS